MNKKCIDCDIKIDVRSIRCIPCDRTRKNRRGPTIICSIEGCNEPIRTNGLCRPHYNDKRRKGRSLYTFEKDPKRRSFLKCVKDAGWTEERFIAFNYAQGGLCYFCSGVSYQKGNLMRLCMDHNHETGEPRGLLCQRCNQFLWFYEDNDRARLAEQYLRRVRNDDYFN